MLERGNILSSAGGRERFYPCQLKFQKSQPDRAFLRGLKCDPLLERGVEPHPAVCKQVKFLGLDEASLPLVPFLQAPLIKKVGGERFKFREERTGHVSWFAYF